MDKLEASHRLLDVMCFGDIKDNQALLFEAGGSPKQIVVFTDAETYKNSAAYKFDVLLNMRKALDMHALFGVFFANERGIELAAASLRAQQGSQVIRITKQFNFAYGHRLRSTILSEELNLIVYGKCYNQHGHGHNATLEVTLKGFVDNVTGMLINFNELKRIVNTNVIEHFDHRFLNKDEPTKTLFAKRPTTCENSLPIIWRLLEDDLPVLEELRLSETDNSWASLKRKDIK